MFYQVRKLPRPLSDKVQFSLFVRGFLDTLANAKSHSFVIMSSQVIVFLF